MPSAQKITQERLKNAEYARAVHCAKPEAATTLKDVLVPEYWAHVAAKFTVGDHIEVLPEGGAWYAELLVVACSRLHAKVVVLKELQLDASPKGKEEKADFLVEFKGPQRKWSVIRGSDKQYVKEGFDTKEDAVKWLEANKADLTA